MCGINGIFAYLASAPSPDERELILTRDAMRNRGPDGCGSWWNINRRCGLAHRRLSIIDLSDRAAQPMGSADGRLTVVFNGEIYNYPNLRANLEAKGAVFRTSSDTEVLLHLYSRYGQEMVQYLRGMFAFAIWDADKTGLFLARDPYGIKPLYTTNDGWTFRFASQVKALLEGGRVSRDLAAAGAVGFCLFGAVQEPDTIFRDIAALPAGHSQWVDQAGPREPRSYVSLAKILAEGNARKLDPSELVERVRYGVRDSVAAHLLSDVEVGVFLSAGIDSTTLLATMRELTTERITAVTLGFDEYRGRLDDEVPLAEATAKRFGIVQHTRRVSEREFCDDLPKILGAMDQPSIDGVNTWFVSKAANELGLKVALSGLGGDELFGGYPSFQDLVTWRRLCGLPSSVPLLGKAVRVAATKYAPSLFRRKPKALGVLEYAGTLAGRYFLRRALFLPYELPDLLGREFAIEGLKRSNFLSRIESNVYPDPGTNPGRGCVLESSIYMRNQLLRDADWAGMAHGLEIRVPLVDIQLLRTVSSVIGSITGGRGKGALAQVPTKNIPSEIAARRKTGFTVPISRWVSRAIENRPAGTTDETGLTSRRWARRILKEWGFQTADLVRA